MARARLISPIGAALETARRAAGLRPGQLTAALEVDRSTMMRLRRGQSGLGPYSRAQILKWALTLPPAIGAPVLAAIGEPAAAPSVSTAAGEANGADDPRRVEEAFLSMADALNVGARDLRQALARFVRELGMQGVSLASIDAALEAVERRAAKGGIDKGRIEKESAAIVHPREA